MPPNPPRKRLLSTTTSFVPKPASMPRARGFRLVSEKPVPSKVKSRMLVPDAATFMKKPLRARFPTGPGTPAGHPITVVPSPTRFRVFVILAPHHLPGPTRIVSPGLALLTAIWIVGKSRGTRWVACAKEADVTPKTTSARAKAEKKSFEFEIGEFCSCFTIVLLFRMDQVI